MTTRDRFAKLLDDALGEGPPDVALRVQRANVLSAIRRGRRPWARVRWELAAGVLAVVAAAAVLALARARSEVLTASWRGGVALPAAASVEAGERTEKIEFSDGSSVVLEPRATASVVRLEPSHAQLALKAGKLSASVRHRDGLSWSVAAGPYEVRVVGTRFTVEWEQASQTFQVAVTEGRVRVSGGDLGEHTLYLDPGQHFERRGGVPVAAQAPHAPDAPATPTPVTPVTPVTEGAVAPKGAPSSPPPAATVGELAQAGKYREALALAEERGFERVVAELPEGELLALGNAARYSGSAGRARQAMLALRERFPGRPAAGLAALYLARIAEQLDKNPKEAARWLRVFLAESPTGSLAADARASLLSILLASGDTAGATVIARDYLRYHPAGPIADRARVLVSRSEGK